MCGQPELGAQFPFFLQKGWPAIAGLVVSSSSFRCAIPLLAEGVARSAGVVSSSSSRCTIPLLAEGVAAIADGVVSATHGKIFLKTIGDRLPTLPRLFA